MSRPLLSTAENLDLSNNNLTELSKLNGHANLKTLNLSNNLLEFLGPANSHMEHPDNVTLIQNPWSQCTLLQQLDLSNNKISNLEQLKFLHPLKLLTSLDLRGNPITQIPLYKHYVISLFPRLTYLDQNSVPVEFVREARAKCDTAHIDFLYKRIDTLLKELESAKRTAMRTSERTPRKTEPSNTDEIIALQKKIDQLEKVAKERQSDLLEAQNRILDLEKTNHRDQVENDRRLIETLKELNIICPTLTQPVTPSVSSSDIDDLLIQKAHLQREIADLKEERKVVTAEIEQLKPELDTLKTTTIEARESAKTNKILKQETEQEIELARDELKTLTSTLKSLRQERDTINEDLDKLLISKNSVASALSTDTDDEKTRLRRENAELHHQIKLMKDLYSDSPVKQQSPMVMSTSSRTQDYTGIPASPITEIRKAKLLQVLKNRDTDNNVHKELLQARCELKSVLADIEYYKKMLNRIQREVSSHNLA